MYAYYRSNMSIIFLCVSILGISKGYGALCPEAPELQNGNQSLRGPFLIPFCNEGFKLKGPSRRLCFKRKWVPIDEPVCEEFSTRKCEPVPITEVVVHPNDYHENHTVGAEIWFSCGPLMYNAGSSYLKCLEDGTWNLDVVDCRPEENFTSSNACDIKIPSISNGHLGLVNGTVREFEIFCDDGYTLIGERYVEFGDEQWNQEFGTCEELTCDPLPLVLNVVFVPLEENEVIGIGSYVRIECTDGLVNTGKQFTRCRKDGSWLLPDFKCEKPQAAEFSCDYPEVIENGKLSSAQNVNAEYKVNSTIKYECYFGYKLVGEGSRACTEDGWTGELPYCEKLSCDPLPTVLNVLFLPLEGDEESGEIGSYVRIECTDGLVNTGKQYMRCLKDGSWLLPDFECEKPQPTESFCEDPEMIANGKYSPMGVQTEGYKINSMVKYECDFGYRLQGESSKTCSEDGWTGDLPHCQLIQCMPPGTRIRGPATKMFNPGELIRVKCPKGEVVIKGSNILLCQLDGTWNDTLPKCQVVKCPKPDIPDNGYITSKHPSSKFYSYNSQVVYHCNPGFSLVGSQEARCTVEGWSNEAPQCLAPDYSQCGIISKESRVQTYPIIWPWTAIIYYHNPELNVSFPICSGSLIDQKFVLTAGSCFPEYLLSDGYSKLFLEIGIENSSRSYVKTISQNYDDLSTEDNFYANLALIELIEPVEFGPLISPICLPKGNTPEVGRLTAFTSWRHNKTMIINSTLLSLKTQNEILCRMNLEENDNRLSSNVFCANGKGLPKVCGADFGGPLLVEERHLDGQTFWVQIGILNIPETCGLNKPKYTYFQNIHSARSWIVNVLTEVIEDD